MTMRQASRALPVIGLVMIAAVKQFTSFGLATQSLLGAYLNDELSALTINVSLEPASFEMLLGWNETVEQSAFNPNNQAVTGSGSKEQPASTAKNFTKSKYRKEVMFSSPNELGTAAPLGVGNRNDFDVELEQLIHNRSFTSPRKTMFGFFYQCYKRPKATLEIIQTTTYIMPDSPIYLVSSGGYHYEPLEKRYPRNVHFVYDDVNVNLHGEGGKLDRWFNWIKAAALWCNCEYLVLLEDDVIIREPLTERPLHDAGGVNSPRTDFQWPAILSETFGTNFTFQSYGMCGGSYVRVEAFLEAHSRLNWTRIFAMRDLTDKRLGMISDMTLALVMMDSGYNLRPWNKVSNKYWRNSSIIPILHNEKKYYQQKLQSYDGEVISDKLDKKEAALVWS